MRRAEETRSGLRREMASGATTDNIQHSGPHPRREEPGAGMGAVFSFFQKRPEGGADGRFAAAGDGHPCPAAHPQLPGGELGRRRQVDDVGAVGLHEAVIRQQGFCHLRKRHPQREGRHILPAGKVEVDHMVGAFQILNVRKGQGTQPRCRGDADHRAVLRLGGPVQQGRQLLGTEGDVQILHGIHPERLVGVGRGVGQKGQRCPAAPLPQLCRCLQARRRVGRGKLDEVQLVPPPLGLPFQQLGHAGELLHHTAVGPAGIVFQTVALHPAPQHRVRTAHRNVKVHRCILLFHHTTLAICAAGEYHGLKKEIGDAAMNQPLVSIILPVYNAQTHLARCIGSILNQTYRNLELIILNDGSRDQSLPVCEEFRVKDSRIVLVDKDNSGVSDTRNLGLKLAGGQYVQFVDSDDYIDPDFTGHLVAAAEENNADLVIAPYKMVIPAGASKPEQVLEKIQDDLGVMSVARPPEVREYGFLPAGVYDKDTFALRLMDKPASYFYSVLWNKLYRRDLLVENDVQFASEMKWAEDLVFNLQYIRFAERFVSIGTPGYYYVQNPQSICHTQINPATIVQNKVQTFRYYKDLYTRLGMYEEVRPQLYKFLVDIAESTYPSGPFKKVIEEAKAYWRTHKQ